MINLLKKLFGITPKEAQDVPTNKNIATLGTLEKVTGQLDLKPKRKKK